MSTKQEVVAHHYGGGTERMTDEPMRTTSELKCPFLDCKSKKIVILELMILVKLQ